MRDALTEPNSIVVDRVERDRLGITGVGDYAEINKVRVRVVGETKGLKSLAGPYVFCSRPTAKLLAPEHDPARHDDLLPASTATTRRTPRPWPPT